MSDIDSSDDNDFDFDSDLDSADLTDIQDGLASEVNSLTLCDFKITTLEEVRLALAASTHRASEMTGLSEGIAQLLLNSWDWNLGEMTSVFIDDPDKCARKLGLPSRSDIDLLMFTKGSSGADKGQQSVEKTKQKRTKNKSLKTSSANSFECPICLESNVDSFSLKCGHEVCTTCFTKHIQINCIEQRRVFTTTCPGSSECALLLSRDVVADLVQEDELNRYDQLVAQIYIDKHPTRFAYCPKAGCTYIAERVVASGDAHSSKAIPVECRCDSTFCFQCGLATDHYAVPCDLASQWLARVDHEHRSSLWILQNTKQCPQCRTKIQRSEGCNHMVCMNCRFEFCWICSLSWADHSGKSYYNCVKFVPEDTKSPGGPDTSNSRTRTGKRQKERLEFYMSRYDNHASLVELVEDAKTKKAHNLLAWAFVLLCFAVHNNQKLLLEEMVTDLGRDIEYMAPRLKQRTEALADFLMSSNWIMDQNIRLSMT